MIKKLLFIILILGLAGCDNNLGEAKITTAEFKVGSNRIIINEQNLGANENNQIFKPEVRLTRWDEEEDLIVLVTDEVEDKATQKGNKLISKSKDGKREYHFYTKTANEIGNEEGGFEYELILNEKLDTNVFTWQLENWEDLDFYYQDEKKLNRPSHYHTPENIIGSYAVYHKTKVNNQYKTGKLFHIYRPKISDKKGDWIWGEMDIKNGIITIKVDSKWLDNAKYPVSVDPTFGYTSIGGDTYYISTNQLTGDRYTAPESGTVDSISIYCKQYGSGDRFKGVIVDTSKNLVTNGVGAIADPLSSASWVVSAFSTSPSITASTNYYIGYVETGEMDVYYDAISITYIYDSTNSYATPQNPTDGNVNTDTYKSSFYATYTADTPPASPDSGPPQSPIIIFN